MNHELDPYAQKEKFFAEIADRVFDMFPSFKTLGTKEQYIRYLKIYHRGKNIIDAMYFGSKIDEFNFQKHVEGLLSGNKK